MQLASWTAPGGSEELVVRMGPADARARLLVLPAWFDEANKTRHFTIELMRDLAAMGVASELPDLPGCNESKAALAEQSLPAWRDAAACAADQLHATHVLAIRAAVSISPALPGWAYAPVPRTSVLRALLRARVMASREAGRTETTEALLETGRTRGLSLVGYRIGPRLVSELADPPGTPSPLVEISQDTLGAGGLWLRAEPDHDASQAQALATLIAQALPA
jgi:hypothetical protein